MTVVREKSGRFAKGWSGGPGRPRGARSKLSELALAALGTDFEQHGKEAIETVRRERPHTYLALVVSLLPRQLSVERTSPLGDLSDAELAELEAHLAASRARLVEKLERSAAVLSLVPSDAKRAAVTQQIPSSDDELEKPA